MLLWLIHDGIVLRYKISFVWMYLSSSLEIMIYKKMVSIAEDKLLEKDLSSHSVGVSIDGGAPFCEML